MLAHSPGVSAKASELRGELHRLEQAARVRGSRAPRCRTPSRGPRTCARTAARPSRSRRGRTRRASPARAPGRGTRPRPRRTRRARRARTPCRRAAAPTRRRPRRTSRLDRRPHDVELFAAEQAALPRVRVDAANGDLPAPRRRSGAARGGAAGPPARTSSAVTASDTDRSERWIVSRATRSPPPTNIIATSVTPAASASSSVCPGQPWPAACSDSLLIGAVTRPASRPASASPAARRTARRPRRPPVCRHAAETGTASPPTSTTRAVEGGLQAEDARRASSTASGP